MNVLFICSHNQWRSPTAEQVFRHYPELAVRSAGTSRSVRKTVNHELLSWADVVYVMKQKHKKQLIADFRRLIEHKTLHMLDTPDDYHYTDPELITLLEDTVVEEFGLGVFND